MKVILLADVKNVGKKGEVATVADGYGRNYLLRNKLAVIASERGLEILEEQKEQDREDLKERKTKAEALKAQLDGLLLNFTVTAGAEGRVFGSVSTKQIAEELSKKHQITVDKKKFLDNGPFNELGVHEVRIELFKGVVANIKVNLNAK